MRFLRGLALTSLVIIMSLALARPVLAQQTNTSNEDEGIGVGVEGMITNTSLRGQGASDLFKSRTGTGFGLWVGGNRNGLIGFTGEFIYLIKKVDQSGQELKTRALEIPAVFHINFGSSSRNSVAGYALVGPVFTINLKQTLASLDVSGNFNGADIGVAAGAGVEFFRIGIEGRGNWGLRNISDTGATANLKSFTFELLGKFRFN